MSGFGIETVDLYNNVLAIRASLQIPEDIPFTKRGSSALRTPAAEAIRKGHLA